METEQRHDLELDKLIHNALSSDTDLMIPRELTGKTILRIKRRMLLKELVLDLFCKAGLVLGSLIVLAGVFVWIKGSDVLTILSTYLVNNWQLFSSLLILTLTTVLIDQVGLRFYALVKNDTGQSVSYGGDYV